MVHVQIKTKPTKLVEDSSSPSQSTTSEFWSHRMYAEVAKDFHRFHQHDLNCALHLLTTTLAVWASLHLVVELGAGVIPLYVYMVLVALTTPWRTALIHSGLILLCLHCSAPFDVVGEYISGYFYAFKAWQVSAFTIALGYGLQDVAHWICVEPTYMGSYLKEGKPWMLLLHTFWLLPLVIDSILMRHCFLPLLVNRNRNIVTVVDSKDAVIGLRKWIMDNVEYSAETTHIWPHEQKGTDRPVTDLENDKNIEAAFRTVFAAKHYDIKTVQSMNEIYVTAVGAKKQINSDGVFYTPHIDGPFFWLPGASLYRVLVGVTPNTQVRTRFNLQHSSRDQVLDQHGVVGFDYNRELHWIDHVPDKINIERRSVIKLHFIVYPKGWHWYGNFCAWANTAYNTWARGNFLQTLRPTSSYDNLMAWWIMATTWSNATFEELFGWSNLIYIGVAYWLGGFDSTSLVFVILTSFRHYAIYMATFAYRKPMVAHGYLMRDSKLFKTIAMIHLARRLLPMVEPSRDWIALIAMSAGFIITMLATLRLGYVRTYFGSELDFVKPKWIEGFPYGTIPHPMIVGQLIGFGVILNWYRAELTISTTALLVAHMTCYTVHMFQEILFSSY